MFQTTPALSDDSAADHRARREPMRHRSTFMVPFLAAGVALAVGACSGAAAPQWTYAPTVTPNPPAAVPAAQPAVVVSAPLTAPAAGATPMGASVSLNLTIVTGDMTGKTEWPAYIPSDFSLPANATVTVTITNFDNATPLAKGAESYAKASGIVGDTFTVTPIKSGEPNGAAGPSTTLAALDPAQVSHTFTIAALGINVPIAPKSRETFVIHTGAPGTYAWRCFDPCGMGSSGWGSAMAAKRGYMSGTLTIVG